MLPAALGADAAWATRRCRTEPRCLPKMRRGDAAAVRGGPRGPPRVHGSEGAMARQGTRRVLWPAPDDQRGADEAAPRSSVRRWRRMAETYLLNALMRSSSDLVQHKRRSDSTRRAAERRPSLRFGTAIRFPPDNRGALLAEAVRLLVVRIVVRLRELPGANSEFAAALLAAVPMHGSCRRAASAPRRRVAGSLSSGPPLPPDPALRLPEARVSSPALVFSMSALMASRSCVRSAAARKHAGLEHHLRNEVRKAASGSNAMTRDTKTSSPGPPAMRRCLQKTRQ